MSTLVQANAFLGSVARLAMVGLAGAAGFLGWRVWRADAEHARELAELHQQLGTTRQELDTTRQELAVTRQELERVALALKLMKVDRGVARIAVLDQTRAAAGAPLRTSVRFERIDRDGNALGAPKELTIDGDLLYVDSWVVKFDDELIEKGDPLRSSSLVLFRRLFGEHQTPSAGLVLDGSDEATPDARASSGASALEREVWAEFWEIANDPERAARLGIRAAHGEADSMKLKKGAAYTVTLRSSGGLAIQPDTSARGSN